MPISVIFNSSEDDEGQLASTFNNNILLECVEPGLSLGDKHYAIRDRTGLIRFYGNGSVRYLDIDVSDYLYKKATPGTTVTIKAGI